MSDIYFFSPENGLVLKNEEEVFSKLDCDLKNRMWMIAAYRCMIHNIKEWKTRTPTQKLMIQKLKTGIYKLCLKFPKSFWPEIHHVKKEFGIIPDIT